MRWKSERVALSAADLRILKQVGFRLEEVPRRWRIAPGLPPLWSVLSYVLWRQHGDSAPVIWREYRQLRELVRHRDAYYRQVWIPKNGGGARRLSIPDGELRAHQEWINGQILARLKVSEHAWAYRKGGSVRECAAPHCGHKVLIHLDIKDFFGSITEGHVVSILRKTTGYSDTMAKFLAAVCCQRKRLPQGAVTSPALSNIVFEPLDNYLARRAELDGWSYTRYADDLYISGDIDDPQTVICHVRGFLQLFGFELNEEKTQVIRQGRRMKVLGITTNENLQVTRQYRRDVRQEVYYLLKYGKDAAGVKAAGDYETYLLQLLGKVSFILQVNAQDERAQQAKRQLLQLLWQHRTEETVPLS